MAPQAKTNKTSEKNIKMQTGYVYSLRQENVASGID